MGRHFEPIAAAKRGRLPAEYLRRVVTGVGLTCADIAEAGSVRKTTVQARLDGRLLTWSTMELLIEAIQLAARRAGVAGELPADLFDQTRALWRACHGQTAVPAGRAGGGRRPADVSPAPEVLVAPPPLDPDDPVPLARFRQALRYLVTRNGTNLDCPRMFRFTHVPLSAELVTGVLDGTADLTRDLVGAIAAAADVQPTGWEHAYDQIVKLQLDRAAAVPQAAPRPRPEPIIDFVVAPMHRPPTIRATARVLHQDTPPPAVRTGRPAGGPVDRFRTPETGSSAGRHAAAAPVVDMHRWRTEADTAQQAG